MYICGAQVGNPHVARAGEKNVFRLKVSVHDTHIVESIESQCLVEKKLSKSRTERNIDEVGQELTIWAVHRRSCALDTPLAVASHKSHSIKS